MKADRGSTLLAAAANRLYQRASFLASTGNWPYAFSQEAITRSAQATEALKAGLNLHPTWKNTYFNVTFNNGSSSAQLPGLFVHPKRDTAVAIADHDHGD